MVDMAINVKHEGDKVHFEKTLTLGNSRNIDPKKKKQLTIWDFEDIDYDMDRI